MRKVTWMVLLMLLTVIFSNGVFAQKPVDNKNLEIIMDETYEFYRFDNMRVNKTTGVPVALYKVNYEVNPSTPEDMARQYLFDNADFLFHKNDIDDLVHSSTRETPGGYHVRFDQYFGQYQVYNSNIVVNINHNNVVNFVMNDFKPGVNIASKNVAISQTQAKKTAINRIGINGKIYFEKVETVVYNNKKGSRLVQKVNIVPSEDHFGDWEVLVDASTGEIIRLQDKAIHSSKKATGTGWVFNPDPLTRAGATYGDSGFSDNDDADHDSLTAQLATVVLQDLTYSGGQYHLSGPYAQVVDSESPFNGLYSQSDSVFHFTRFDDAFEAVNVYYHLDKSMRYINETLGFNLMPHQYTGGVKGDPHGLSGADNSHYISSTGEVAWGEGGVDDAEDEDVLLHELGHGLHDWLTNGNLSQVDGLSEGCGDYWAVSHNRSTGFWAPSDPQYNWVFQWDGHNPFWDGRVTDYPNLFPGGLVGQIHTDGQIWASTLMQIYDDIGRIATDSDFLEALSMTNGSSGQEDAAQAFIQADVNLFGGANLGFIEYWFTQRGYNVSVPTPQITHTPLGDTEDLTGPYQVTATIAAAGPLAEAVLIYGSGGVFTDSVDMTIVTGNEYSASIPGSGSPADYNYYIFAADSLGLASTSPAGAPANYHQFYAGPDTIAPIISHTPLRDQAYIRWPAAVNANVTDNLGVASVIVNYYVNNPATTGSFALTDQGNGNYSGTFDIDTSSVSVGDSIFYRITATDNSSSSNITNDPTSAFHQFNIMDALGIVLVIDDDPTTKTTYTNEKGTFIRDINKALFGLSANLFSNHLNYLGYVVDTVEAALTDPITWDNYDFIVWSSGVNGDPISNATHQTDLVSYVNNGGKLLIEGGETGWIHRNNGDFTSDVLHITGWVADHSAGSLNKTIPNHAIAANLPQTIGFTTQTTYFDIDALVIENDAYYVFDWTASSGNPGVIVYDDNPNPQSAQIIFFSFAASSITNQSEAEMLIENASSYLMTPESGAVGEITGNVDLTDTVNDSGVVVYLNGFENDTTVTNSNGDYAFTGLYNGIYSVTTGHAGYFPYSATIDSIEVADNTVSGNNFAFDPVTLGSVSGTVLLSDTTQNIFASILVVGQNTVSDSTDGSGNFSTAGVMPGNIRVFAMKEGYVSASVDTFLANDGSNLQIDFMLYPGTNSIVFDFENDNGGFTGSGSWEWGSPSNGPGSAYQGVNLWATGLATDYGSGENSELITPELNLSGFANPKLTFAHWYDIEENTITPGNAYDGGNVKISTDGGSTFSSIDPLGGYPYTISAASNVLNGQGVFSSTSAGWELAEFDLSAYAGMNVVLKLHFGTDGSVQLPGWYVDSLAVSNEMAIPQAPANLTVLDSLDNVTLGWDDVTKNLLNEKPIQRLFSPEDLQAILEKEQNSGNSQIGLENLKADSYNIYRGMDGVNFSLTGSSVDTMFTDTTVTVGNMYYYYVTAILGGLESIPSNIVAVTVGTATGIFDDWGKGIPNTFAIEQNYPNPFNPVTTIRYQLPKASHVKLEIFTITGQKVKTLINAYQSTNYYTIKWNGLNEVGSKVSSGVYLYRIEAGEFVKTNKMLLLK